MNIRQTKGVILSTICFGLILASLALIWFHRGRNKQFDEFSGETNDFILNLNDCKIPRVLIKNKNFLKFWNPKSSNSSCLSSDHFSNLVDDDKRLILHGNESSHCCLQNITPLDNPKGYSVSPKCSELQNSTEMGMNEFILVQCNSLDNKKVNFNFHAAIPVKPDVADKAIFWESNFKKSERPISVLMIILDATSRNHAFRSLPRTMKYLKELNFIDFKGHHIKDESSWLNFVSMLGESFPVDIAEKGLWRMSKSDNVSELKLSSEDKNYSLFSVFSKLKYITMSLDTSKTFPKYNNEHEKTKVDYDLKAFLQAHREHKEAALDKMTDKGNCFGNKTSTNYLLNYIRRFYRKFEVVPTFSVNYFAESEPSRVDSLFKQDKTFLKFFKGLLQSREILENTLIIFTSTDGYLDHPYSKTHDGYIDRRLPLLLSRLPNSIIKRNPNFLKNMHTNQFRITSYGDTYKTLITVAKMARVILKSKNLSENAANDQFLFALANKFGLSLFENALRPSRSCADADVPSYACACGLPIPVQKNSSKIEDLLDDHIPGKVILPDPTGSSSMHEKIE